MKEQFVTYEIALAMKELGFDGPCIAYWRDGIDNLKPVLLFNFVLDHSRTVSYRQIEKNIEIPAPLWQQVIDWFLTEKNISIHVGALFISNITNPFWKVTMKIDSHISEKTYGGFSDTTLKGKEIAILKCIELCKQKK